MRSSRLCNYDFLAANIDHGLLLGLTDDDHTQYLLANGTRALGGNWNLGGYNLTNGGSGRFDGGIGIGDDPTGVQDVIKISVSGQPIAVHFVNTGIPDALGSVGLYNTITCSGIGSAGHGVSNQVYAEGQVAQAYGIKNDIRATGDNALAFGIYSAVKSGVTDDQMIYGASFIMEPHTTDDTAYGVYIIDSAGTITDPTVDQIGLYLDWNIAGTDTHSKKWAIYSTGAANSYLGGGLTVAGTFSDGTASLLSGDLTGLTSLVVDNLTLDGATIVSDTGTINFVNENLTTTGIGAFESVNITKTDLITNGDFDSDLTGWTAAGGTAWDSGGDGGRVEVGTWGGTARTTMTTVANRTYMISFSMISLETYVSFKIGTSASASDILHIGWETGLGKVFRGDNVYFFVASGTTTHIEIKQAGGTVAYFDNCHAYDESDFDGALKVDGLVADGLTVNGMANFFIDTSVDNALNGGILKVWRNAAEGQDSIGMYVYNNRTPVIDTNRDSMWIGKQNAWTEFGFGNPRTINAAQDGSLNIRAYSYNDDAQTLQLSHYSTSLGSKRYVEFSGWATPLADFQATRIVTTGTLGAGASTFGDGTNETAISATGDLVFVGSAGLVFGSCSCYEIGWTQVAVQNTWYNVSDAAFIDGLLNNVTHDGNGELTVLKAGIYKIDVSCDWECNAANKHVEVGFEISNSGSAATEGIVCCETKFANEEDSHNTTALLDLAVNATIEICVRTTDVGTPTIKVNCVSLNCVQIGGT